MVTIRIYSVIALALFLLVAPLAVKGQSIQNVQVATRPSSEPHTVAFNLEITGWGSGNDKSKVTVIVTPQSSFYKPAPEDTKISADGTQIEASFKHRARRLQCIRNSMK